MSIDEGFDRRERGNTTFRKVSEISRALVILGVGFVLLLGNWLKIEFVMQIDNLLRYGFGGISLLYGGFRLYRGIKSD
jgi:hypothetical protein